MAKICCICDKKISMMDYSYHISADMDKLYVCEECNRYLRKLEKNITDEETHEAEIYFERFINRNNVSDEVRKYIKLLESSVHDKIKAVKEKEMYNFALKSIDSYVEEHTDIQHMDAVQNLNFLKENHLLTSGYEFEGYKIESYKGIVSGDVVLGTGFLSELAASLSDIMGIESDEFGKKLKLAKKSAIKDIIQETITVGGNAIIGINFDYSTFSNNMIGVSVNGTAVKVEACKK